MFQFIVKPTHNQNFSDLYTLYLLVSFRRLLLLSLLLRLKVVCENLIFHKMLQPCIEMKGYPFSRLGFCDHNGVTEVPYILQA